MKHFYRKLYFCDVLAVVECYAKSAFYSEVVLGFLCLYFFLWFSSTFQKVTTTLTFLDADAAGGQLLLPISKPVGP